jgi:hypothetical protein
VGKVACAPLRLLSDSGEVLLAGAGVEHPIDDLLQAMDALGQTSDRVFLEDRDDDGGEDRRPGREEGHAD